jgi:hypothetical protein
MTISSGAHRTHCRHGLSAYRVLVVRATLVTRTTDVPYALSA